MRKLFWRRFCTFLPAPKKNGAKIILVGEPERDARHFKPPGAACSPGGAACSPGGAACSPGGAACSPGGAACLPGGAARSPGVAGCSPGWRRVLVGSAACRRLAPFAGRCCRCCCCGYALGGGWVLADIILKPPLGKPIVQAACARRARGAPSSPSRAAARPGRAAGRKPPLAAHAGSERCGQRHHLGGGGGGGTACTDTCAPRLSSFSLHTTVDIV